MDVRTEAAVGCSEDTVTVLLLTPGRDAKVRYQKSFFTEVSMVDHGIRIYY